MGIIKWARKKSPWVFHLCTGGCNGCDIELLAALTPKYAVERLVIKLVGSPRHADVLITTGILTKKTYKKFLRVYEQTPEPKKL
jgi:membrane-bound hydrogenase subunit mbhJ